MAYVAELFRSRQGRGGAAAELRDRAGSQLDPDLVRLFMGCSQDLFDLLDDPERSVFELLFEAEPTPPCHISDAHLDNAALAFARFTDLKSAWFTVHSEDVADVAASAAGQLGLGPGARTALLRAGLLHDIGQVGVPTGIWDLVRPLSPHEWDRIRFHAWETDRILSSTPLFGSVAQIAAAAHERANGSGYHRGHVPGGPRDAVRRPGGSRRAVRGASRSPVPPGVRSRFGSRRARTPGSGPAGSTVPRSMPCLPWPTSDRSRYQPGRRV